MIVGQVSYVSPLYREAMLVKVRVLICCRGTLLLFQARHFLALLDRLAWAQWYECCIKNAIKDDGRTAFGWTSDHADMLVSPFMDLTLSSIHHRLRILVHGNMELKQHLCPKFTGYHCAHASDQPFTGRQSPLLGAAS